MPTIKTIGTAGLIAAAAAAGSAAAQTADAQSLGAGEFSCAHLVAMAPDDAEHMLYFIAGRMADTPGGADAGAAEEGGPAPLEDVESDDPQFDPRLMQLTPVDAVGFFDIDVEAIWNACMESSEETVAELIEEGRRAEPATD